MQVWLIDDTHHHHQVVAATVALVPAVQFRGFMEGSSGISAFAEAVRQGTQPEAVLMDFFLGDDRGDVITRRLRQCEKNQHSVIIGYSSATSGSEAIIAAGGDLSLPKRSNDAGINPHVLRWLRAALQAGSP